MEIISQRLHHGFYPNSTAEENTDAAGSRTKRTNRKNKTKTPLGVDKDGEKHFNHVALFDLIHTGGNRGLSCEEINKVLQLSLYELIDFDRRMTTFDNTEPIYAPDDQTPPPSVLRRQSDLNASMEIFVMNFLDAMDKTSNFGLTRKEAEKCWYEMAGSHKIKADGEMQLAALYDSDGFNVLTEFQIHKLTKKFQSIVKKYAVARDVFCENCPKFL